jgi:hypothetical protein
MVIENGAALPELEIIAMAAVMKVMTMPMPRTNHPNNQQNQPCCGSQHLEALFWRATNAAQ